MYRREDLEKVIEKILEKSTPGHDIEHMLRVWNLAKQIIDGEKISVDEEIVYAACMLHDVGHTIYDPKDPLYVKHPIRSMEIARKVLPEIGFPEEKIPLTLEAIRLHDDTKPWGTKTKTDKREIWYVQDADNIEALGANGLTRLILFCIPTAKMKDYIPELSLDDPKARWESMVHDVYAHGLELYDNLHTHTAKTLVGEGKTFMLRFVELYIKERNLAKK
jgi:HD superfamily phosphodiesterase